MDREQLLKQEIDKIVAYGKSKGSISEDDIMARLEHLNATAEDMEMVFNALQNENVKVEETIEEDDIALDKIIDCLYRKALCRPRHAVPRSDSGR